MAAAIEFADATGKVAAIGSLEDIGRIVAGTAGTRVTRDADQPLVLREPGA